MDLNKSMVHEENQNLTVALAMIGIVVILGAGFATNDEAVPTSGAQRNERRVRRGGERRCKHWNL